MPKDNVRQFRSEGQTKRSQNPGAHDTAAGPNREDSPDVEAKTASPNRPNPSADGAATRRGPQRSPNFGDRQGCYLLTFGLPGAGKTTFHCYMMRYLRFGHENHTPTDAQYSVTACPPSDNPEGEALGDTWYKLWEENAFPPRTPTGEDEIQEIVYHVHPSSGSDDEPTPLTFGFIEASGELMEGTLMSDGPHSDEKLSKTFRVLLKNENLNIILMLIVSPNHTYVDTDKFFNKLLELLDRDFEKRLQANFHIGVVLADPHAAYDKMEAPSSNDSGSKLEGDIAAKHITTMMRETSRRLAKWGLPVGIFPLSLGTVEKHEFDDPAVDGDASEHRGAHIVSVDLKDSERIFNWIYERFTGKSAKKNQPRRTWKQRLESWTRFI